MLFLGLALALGMRQLVSREIRKGREEDISQLTAMREQILSELARKSSNGLANGHDGDA